MSISVLVIDDEEVMRDVLQRLLVEAGYSNTRIVWHLWDQPTNSPTALPLNDLVLSTLTGAADKQLTIPLLLSGDTHHYSRYQACPLSTPGIDLCNT